MNSLGISELNFIHGLDGGLSKIRFSPPNRNLRKALLLAAFGQIGCLLQGCDSNGHQSEDFIKSDLPCHEISQDIKSHGVLDFELNPNQSFTLFSADKEVRLKWEFSYLPRAEECFCEMSIRNSYKEQKALLFPGRGFVAGSDWSTLSPIGPDVFGPGPVLEITVTGRNICVYYDIEAVK